jgi:membrane protein DedA with SNARE-associated domain
MTLDHVLRFVGAYGYAFLFAASFAENVFLLGCIVPGDVVVLIGGGMAAAGRLSAVAVLAVVIAGVALGSLASFGLGRAGGMPLLERWGVRFAVATGAVRAAQDYFVRHGAKTVFTATFVAGLKNVVPALAGASQMPLARFAAYSLTGSALRSAGLVALGYAFGVNVPLAMSLAGKINGWLFAVVAGVVLLAVSARYVYRRRRSHPTTT